MSIDGHFFLAYVESIKAEILANPVLLACANSEDLEKHCDIWQLGDINSRHFESEAIKQNYTNKALNIVDAWLEELNTKGVK
jgi:hypothetical protein